MNWIKQPDGYYLNAVTVRRKSDHHLFAPFTCQRTASEESLFEVVLENEE